MDIEKLESGMEIIVRVSTGESDVEFNTTLLERVDNCLIVDCIRHEGEVVGFAGANFKKEVQIIDKEVSKVYVWSDIEIKAGILRKVQPCHIIYLNGPAKEINRRACYRQYLGIDGHAVMNRKNEMDIIIRDVSNTGIGFIVTDKEAFKVGEELIVIFSDEDNKYKFSLQCKVVREREMDNGRCEFGCKLSNIPQSLSTYIAHKQLANRRRSLGQN